MFGTFFYDIFIAHNNGEFDRYDTIMEKLANVGFEYFDTDINVYRHFDIDEYLNLLKNSGLKTKNCYNITDVDYKKHNIKEAYFDDIRKNLEICKKLDTQMYMPVPRPVGEISDVTDRDYCLKSITEYFNTVVELAKGYNIMITTENFSNPNFPYTYISDLEYIFSQINDIGYVLDSGNFWFTDGDPLKAFEVFSDKIVHVHFKDWLPNTNGFCTVNGKTCDGVALGDGVLPIKELAHLLDGIGYNEGRTVETNDNKDVIKKIFKSISYLKHI